MSTIDTQLPGDIWLGLKPMYYSHAYKHVYQQQYYAASLVVTVVALEVLLCFQSLIKECNIFSALQPFNLIPFNTHTYTVRL